VDYGSKSATAKESAAAWTTSVPNLHKFRFASPSKASTRLGSRTARLASLVRFPIGARPKHLQPSLLRLRSTAEQGEEQNQRPARKPAGRCWADPEGATIVAIMRRDPLAAALGLAANEE